MIKECVGVLAIQGAFEKHRKILTSLGCNVILVKTIDDLSNINRLIIPGGESTSMRIMLKKHLLWDALKDFCNKKPVMGTCAGAILLASKIDYGNEEALEIMDFIITRNSYGRQIDSFTSDIAFTGTNSEAIISAHFIRAPKILDFGSQVNALASFEGSPVLVQQGNKLACTFHPELSDCSFIHSYFLSLS
ncbi:MAG: pyridoxal 5'-phosphate synthase glutaminase subunit PdxT [Burkholderiales bacterium]|nr:pyridoxal 5'-phosphate synthase glutaminase subunit PdxT [Burkholderiales bacterium]